jgi:hypothetical protein
VSGNALEECRETLRAVSLVKMPNLRERPEELPTGVQFGTWKIEQLESYLLLTAEARQEAQLAKLIVQEALDVLQAQWDEIEGWELELPSEGRRTQEQVVQAKRRVNPDLYSSIQTGKRLIDRLSEQVKRLERDDAASSRVYTIITGG